MWDNKAKKASGAMNPKAPDFKCKNPECDGVIWPPKGTTPQPVSEYKGEPTWNSNVKLPPAGVDDRERRIQRQHSQEMALIDFANKGISSYTDEQLVGRINFFVQDLEI